MVDAATVRMGDFQRRTWRRCLAAAGAGSVGGARHAAAARRAYLQDGRPLPPRNCRAAAGGGFAVTLCGTGRPLHARRPHNLHMNSMTFTVAWRVLPPLSRAFNAAYRPRLSRHLLLFCPCAMPPPRPAGGYYWTCAAEPVLHTNLFFISTLLLCSSYFSCTLVYFVA